MVESGQKFVIVGLSGGVDSAVAAFLLKNQDYHVEALFMQNWQDSADDNCSSEEDLKDAKKVCEILQIKLHTVNFSGEYWDRVFQYFLDEYSSGRTPNPDVLCNKEIKFRAFLDHAKSLGADYIATGHYVQKDTTDGKESLLKAVDANKDQSYFLYLLNQEQLGSALFPLGGLTKEKVRQIAEDVGLPNHDKKDSTGICFIGERKFKDFLGEYLLARPGKIITTDDEVVGEHSGLMFYTLGQRKGIGIGGKQSFPEAPWYVAAKDLKNNSLIVTQNKEHPLLMSNRVICDKLHWISGYAPKPPFNCSAKIRYRQLDQSCVIAEMVGDTKAVVEFSIPQWAATPGQSVVFYHQDECLGGGIIVDSE